MRWPSLQGQAGTTGISWRRSGVMPFARSLQQQTLLVSQWQLRRSKVWVFPPAEMFAIVPWDPSSPLRNIWSRMGQARHWVLSATSPLSRTWVSGSRVWQPLPLISSTVPYPAKCSSFRKPQNTFLASVLCTLPRKYSVGHRGLTNSSKHKYISLNN